MIHCSCAELPCPSVNINTNYRENAEDTWNVASWEACSELCRQRQGCTAWSWAHENAGKWALQCVTMTGYRNTAHDTNVVSGGRDCSCNRKAKEFRKNNGKAGTKSE